MLQLLDNLLAGDDEADRRMLGDAAQQSHDFALRFAVVGELINLEETVAWLQLTVLNGGPLGQDMLDVDWGDAARLNVTGCDAEAQTMDTL